MTEDELTFEVKDFPSNRIDVLAIHSQKGGPGKSTLSCNIAYDLAERGHKTLLVDLDVAQPSINYLFNIDQADITCTINDILLGKKSMTRHSPVKTAHPNLDIFPADLKVDIGKGLLKLLESIQNKSFFYLHQLISKALKIGYRFLIFDCAPGYKLESVTAAGLSDTRLFVIKPSTFSFGGAKEMLKTIYTSLDVDATTFFLFNQVPPNLDEKETNLLLGWVDELKSNYKGRLEFLGNFPLDFGIIKNGIVGKYIISKDSGVYPLLKSIVDRIIQDLDERKK